MAAVLNPICCCLKLFAQETAHEPVNAHGCCSASQAETGKPANAGTPSHAQDDCPHYFERDSQISHAADHFESLAKAHQPLIALLPAYELSADAPQSQVALRRIDRAELRPSRPPISQTCCVYLL